MAALFPDDSASHNAVTQLQLDFASAIRSATTKPKILPKNIRRLEKFLNNPYLDINFQINGLSPLSQATRETRVLDKLLEHKEIDLNFRNYDGQTSLFFAVKIRRADSLRLLIKRGALIDQRDNAGRTALSLAAEIGHLDHVKLLIESNADINSTDRKGLTPLSWAVTGLQKDTVEYLLSREDLAFDSQDIKGRTPLVIAAEAGDIECLRLLIDFRAVGRQMTGIERDLLVWATFQQDFLTTQLLLKIDGSLVNHRVKGRTPLSIAVELGHGEITRLLIDAGADVDALDEIKWPHLSSWSFDTYLPTDEILLQFDDFAANRRPTNQTPLLMAAELGRSDILEMLLGADANPNSRDVKQWTALTWAVDKGHGSAVKVLLENKIYIDPRDVEGRTPLMMAARLGETEILSQLIESNAGVNSEDEKNWTSLSWAVANGHERATQLLLDKGGANIDHREAQGRTPFSLAAERGFVQIMQLLIEKGADPHTPDDEGHTGFWWFLKERYVLSINSPGNLGPPKLAGPVQPFCLHALICALPLPNKKDQSGRNWLSWAAEYGDVEVTQQFLQTESKVDKVDINIRDGSGESFSRTPLIWALEGGKEAMINLLKDGDAISLHLLVEGIRLIGQKKVLPLVTTLLRFGYNLSQPDQKGRTALHLACLEGCLELVSALVSAEANLTSRDHSGKTPLQYALKARSKDIVDFLLRVPSVDLKPVGSAEWFNLGDKRPAWIQITKRIQSQGFELELIDDVECNWLPNAKESRLCLCGTESIWSQLPWGLGIRDVLNDDSCYLKHAQKDFGHRFVTYISLAFPYEEQGKVRYPWGVAWTSRKTAEGIACGFISTLSNGSVPDCPSDFFGQLLENLEQHWKVICSGANKKVESLRHDQVKKRGRSRGLVDELAKNALERAALRQCLQSQIEGLNEVLTTNSSFGLEQKFQLVAALDRIGQAVTVRLDHMEQAVRELLHIELAWVSTNEAASFKRVSWITFIFLPPMFVSSLFGMNVNLLQDNPDWRWYILFGGLSLVLTGVLWVISKFVPQMIWRRLMGKRGSLGKSEGKASSYSSV